MTVSMYSKTDVPTTLKGSSENHVHLHPQLAGMGKIYWPISHFDTIKSKIKKIAASFYCF